MEQITGIGGVFIKAKDSQGLRDWYIEKLGIKLSVEGHTFFEWLDKDDPKESGMTVFSVFPEQSSYFSPSQSGFMLNFRVKNLDECLAELRRRGANVLDHVEEYEYGRFGWVIDPEGNKIELWQPISK